MSTDIDAKSIEFGRYGRAVRTAVSAHLDGERERLLLWLPALMGAGIALYFAWPSTPNLMPALAGVAVTAGAAFFARGSARFGLVALLAVLVGFAASGLRDARVAAPVITDELGPVTIEGQVERVERYPRGHLRITLSALSIDRLEAEATPERVRLRVRTGGDAVTPGNIVSLRGVLMPPPPPVAPGAFDFSRKAWFDRLGGVGFTVSPVSVQRDRPEATDILAGWRLARFRDSLTQRLLESVPDGNGAVAVALMTGERGMIPEQVTEDLRASGLAHLLAISGLHIGLMAGLAFFVVRAGLALIPSIALRYPIKKWAAIAALCAAFFYLLVSGGPVPTQRAFAMSAIVLIAILFDRLAITMRLVALVAGAMLLLAPESLLNVSFQMSFAAVIALVAVYEHARTHGWLPGRGDRLVRRLWVYVLGVALTSVVAGLATGFFAVVHFNRFANYGLLANLLAVPVMGLWIMPWAMAAFLLMPFGLEHLALEPMTWGIDLVAGIASWVAHLPGAIGYIAEIPTSATALVCVGGLWLCLWQTRWRVWGLVPICIGLLIAAGARGPDLLIDEQGKLLAVRAEDGRLALNRLRGSAMTIDTWTRRSGQEETVAWFPSPDAGPLSCDSRGCLYRTAQGTIVALVEKPDALEEDCRRADIVISSVPVFGHCDAEHVFDRFDLWRNGAHAFWFDRMGLRVETVAEHQGNRPWSRYAARRWHD